MSPLRAPMHTRGPWTFGLKVNDNEFIVADGIPIAEVISTDCEALEFQANARLIAVAPELLEALEELMETWRCNPDHYAEEIDKYRPLISNARGHR